MQIKKLFVALGLQTAFLFDLKGTLFVLFLNLIVDAFNGFYGFNVTVP